MIEKKESLADSNKGSFYNQEEWLEEYLSRSLCNTVETESEESETEYTEADNPRENGKKNREMPPIEEECNTEDKNIQ